MWVFDATPLIFLARVEQLSLLQQLERACVMPERVYSEVVETGLEQGYPDARRIERGVETGLFDVVTTRESSVASRLRRNPQLSDADVAVLAHAAIHEGVAIMDEAYGRDVAEAEGITTRGTAYLILSLVSQDSIPADKARTTIDAMIDEGWYCAPDVYTKIVRTLDSLDDEA